MQAWTMKVMEGRDLIGDRAAGLANLNTLPPLLLPSPFSLAAGVSSRWIFGTAGKIWNIRDLGLGGSCIGQWRLFLYLARPAAFVRYLRAGF